ncbi:N-acetyltransferase family protein [Pseudochelatococcus sp. G4_1912]|uniref:GNAT family N-acetyltransferase n=1 Tax=Pseudochelatococcus sp. G4_1912 TaxID=3114288 RepID=UPI0039C5BDA5
MIDFQQARLWREFHIRKLFITDLPEYQAHLLRLGQRCRYSRFGAFMSDPILEKYACESFQGNALVLAYMENGIVRGAAEFKPYDSETGRHAEIAFSVEEPWRRRGIGSALFAKLIITAANRNVSRLVMQCLPENQAMQNLALQFKAKLHFDFEERIGTIVNLNPTVFSLAQETTDDWRAFMGAMTGIQKRIWGAVVQNA